MKRLFSKLDDIEHHAGTASGLSLAEKSLLVGVLARRDALFWPWRWTIDSQPPMPEIRRRQAEYLGGTAGIAAKADGRHDWKDAHQRRLMLVSAGLLTATRSSGQVTSVFLTPAGEATARALVGDRLARRADAEMALEIMQAVVDTHGQPVRESVLFCLDCTGDPAEWAHRTELMLPLLTAGCVVADSDTCGRVLYSLTGTGLPEAPPVDIDPSSELDELYIQSFNNERAYLATVEPRDPAECYVPVSASLYWPPTEISRDEK